VRSLTHSVPGAPPATTAPPPPPAESPAPTTARFLATPPCSEPFLDPAHTHSPFPAQLRTQPSTLALSLALRARPGSSAAAHRGPPLVLQSPLSLCRACCLGEFCLFVSSSRHPSVCLQPLWFARSTLTGILLVQPKPRHRRPEASLRPHRCSSAPESPLEVSNPPMHLFPQLLP
jgi:hypothetical protein